MKPTKSRSSKSQKVKLTGWKRRGRSFGSQKHRKPVDKIARCFGIGPDSFVDSCGKKRQRKPQRLVKIADFVVFGFEKIAVKMTQHKVENEQARVDQFFRKMTAVAQIVLANPSIDPAGVHVVEMRLPGAFRGSCVLSLNQFLREAEGWPSFGLAGEFGELLEGKESGVCRYQIQEAGFAIVIAEGRERVEMFRCDLHREKMSCMISGSDIAGRSRTASCAEAYMAKPALAFAARFSRW